MQNHFKTYIFAALGLIAIAAFAGISAVAQTWNQPFSADLALPTYAPTKTATKTVKAPLYTDTITPTPPPAPVLNPANDLQGIEITNTPAALLPSQPVSAPLCGGPPVMTILGIGLDTKDNFYFYGLADAIRIVRVDFVTPRVTVLSLPRDLWVEIPGISDHYGITHGKLNQSYFYGTDGMGYYDGSGSGPGLMSLTLAQNFDLYVDRFITVNMATMSRVIDAVGGIDIYLEEDLDGRSKDGKVDLGYFEAGNHHFNGEDTLRFVRIRMADSDLHRIDRQTQVLNALQEKILSPAILSRIPKLISSFQGAVVTNLSPGDLTALTCLVPEILKEKLIHANFPEGLFHGGYQYDPHNHKRVWVLTGDYDVLRNLLHYFQSGDWPVK